MRTIKSERLKKLESELNDLQQWLKLGLVPKKDIEKHNEEIQTVLSKIQEEKERLQFLKESGESEEFIAPKRGQTRSGYTEMPTIPDIDVGDTAVTEGGFDSDESTEQEGSSIIEEGDEGTAETTISEDNDSFFSDSRRWGRGGILDPDADEW